MHHRDRERPGHRRRRRAARRRPARAARPARPREPRPRRRCICPRRPSGWPGSRRCCPTLPGTGHRLHAHRRRRATGRRVAPRPRHRRRAPTSATRPPTTAIEIERQLLAQRDQVRRRDLRARHGLRQARPRVRRPLPVAGFARSPTTSRSAGPGAASTCASRSCSRGHEDADIQDCFIRTAFPRASTPKRCIGLLAERRDWVPLAEIEATVNVRRTRAQRHAEDPRGRRRGRSATARSGAAPTQPWEYPAERVEAVTAQRRDEQVRMREFLATDAASCSSCASSSTTPTPRRAAAAPLPRRRTSSPIDVDPALVDGGRRSSCAARASRSSRASSGPTASSPKTERSEPGRLSVYGDGGWGAPVKTDKEAGAYSDKLVGRAGRARRASHVRSHARMGHVRAVAERRSRSVARRTLREPARAAVPPGRREAARDRAAGADGEHRAAVRQRRRRVRGHGRVPTGPVFLIDDIVDSRWTLTVVGQLLRHDGSGPVVPLALGRGCPDDVGSDRDVRTNALPCCAAGAAEHRRAQQPCDSRAGCSCQGARAVSLARDVTVTMDGSVRTRE